MYNYLVKIKNDITVKFTCNFDLSKDLYNIIAESDITVTDYPEYITEVINEINSGSTVKEL